MFLILWYEHNQHTLLLIQLEYIELIHEHYFQFMVLILLKAIKIR